ncbi:MAG TPA: class I SAM-dependent methyltransferase [Anaerolineales bacterium]|nr:class I SAM-dependent methyltransferase [Anaerolineales bacterium]
MDNWDDFWKARTSGEIDDSIFYGKDSGSDFQLDLVRFLKFFDPDLPVLDLGCGDGRQTQRLARHFKRVIGVDSSVPAIELAQRLGDGNPNVEFRMLDILDTAAVRRLRDEFGDLNIYMRGFLQMMTRKSRPPMIRNLRILLGSRGTLYQIELAPESIVTLRDLPEEIFEKIPKTTRRVGYALTERKLHYPEDAWSVLAEGDRVRLKSFVLPDGTEVSMPANFLILRGRV